MSQFLHFSHDHGLNFSEEQHHDDENGACSGCFLEIHGPFYYCETCDFKLHKSCFELPSNRTHPLHPYPLHLLIKPQRKKWICEQCRYFCEGLTYRCGSCKFSLDIKCAFSDQKLEQDEMETIINHSSHKHELSLFNCSKKNKIKCYACGHIILSGPAYCCSKCRFFLHKSCTKLPQVTLHPFHKHPVSLQRDSYRNCNACGNRTAGFSYHCMECEFVLDISCYSRSITTVKLNRHQHLLYYFDDVCQYYYLYCDACEGHCYGSVYRCWACDFNLHPNCIPIPQRLKHDHVHPLTYLETIADEDYVEANQCYCHACETKRDPKFPFYTCDKCIYTAHVGCIISETSTGEEVETEGPDMEQTKQRGEAEEDNGDEGSTSDPLEINEQISNVKLKIAIATTRLVEKNVEIESLTAVLEELETELNEIQLLDS